MAETYNPSSCDVVSAQLTPFNTEGSGDDIDITPIIVGFTITQSIERPALHMAIQCYDGIGLLESLPIRGEEKLKITMKAHDLQIEKTIRGRIHSIDNVVPSTGRDAVGYTLHVMTEISYEAALYSITTAFRNKPASSMAHTIFKKYFSNTQDAVDDLGYQEMIPYGGKKYGMAKDLKRYFYLQPSEGFLRLTIPDFPPQDSMLFVSSKAYSANSPSCSFRFFENFDGYYWCTDEFLIQKYTNNNRIVELNYQAFTTLDPRDAVSQITAIEEMKNTHRTNLPSELQGAYLNTVYEIDLNNHTAKRFNYKYLDSIKKYTATTGSAGPVIENDIHSKDFIEETFNVSRGNAKQFMVFRDYDTDKTGGKGEVVRGEQHYKEIIQNRTSYSKHLNATRVSASLKGRLDLQAGQLVKVNARKLNVSGENVPNKQLSGNYLIQSVIHSVQQGLLDTDLKLIKYDWNDGVDI